MTTIISRHPAYITYLLEIGLISEVYEVISHATPEQITGRHVISSGLPNSLACLCKSVTTVPLWLPEELRGVELTLEQVRQFAKPAETFRVFSGSIKLYEVVAYCGDGPGYNTRHSLLKTLSQEEAEAFLKTQKDTSMVSHTIEVFEL